MLVDAVKFPGPAIWQALVLIVLPLYLWVVVYKSEKFLCYSTIGYVLYAVILAMCIIKYL